MTTTVALHHTGPRVTSTTHSNLSDRVQARVHKNGWLKQKHVTPIEAHSPVMNHTKIEYPVTCLATMAYVYAVCAVRVTTISIGGKFQLVSNFTELHALTLATCSYAVQAWISLLLTCVALTHIVVVLLLSFFLKLFHVHRGSWGKREEEGEEGRRGERGGRGGKEGRKRREGGRRRERGGKEEGKREGRRVGRGRKGGGKEEGRRERGRKRGRKEEGEGEGMEET